MEEKIIELKLTQNQVDVIFDCLIGPCSCPPDCFDLVNYVRKLTSYFSSRISESRLDDCLVCPFYKDCGSWK